MNSLANSVIPGATLASGLKFPAMSVFVQGFLEFKGDNPLIPKAQRNIAMMMRGPSAQLVLPFSLPGGSRLTHSESGMIGELIASAVGRDERFRHHEIVRHEITLGPPMFCADIRLQTLVGRLIRGELDRDEQYASARGDDATTRVIQAKKTNALQHGKCCRDCGLTLEVQSLPAWHLQCPIWELLEPWERQIVQEAISLPVDYATIAIA